MQLGFYEWIIIASVVFGLIKIVYLLAVKNHHPFAGAIAVIVLLILGLYAFSIKLFF